MDKAPSMDLYLPEDSRKVGHSGHPLASGSSPGSVSSKLRKLKSTALLRMQIKAEEMEKELHLMKARNEVRLAELELDSDDDSVVDVQVDTRVKVKDYLTGIRNSKPICETPAVQLSYALLYSGSDVTLVTKGLLDEAGLTGAPRTLNLSTVSGTAIVEAGSPRIEIQSVDSGETVTAEQASSIGSLPISPLVTSLTKVASQYSHWKDTTFRGAS
ncbi:hypothetical protein CLF_111303 [Clonorchis sinensis]|uniref:Uncharacterized protein n=1 Tax=Clonorchis sinensis TaxID=79923 RepID=G7YUL5_CLOSI|nr:hypothetical protein CLF_111303 [Clonorchis sinensis]